jgi:hypothetical protein
MHAALPNGRGRSDQEGGGGNNHEDDDDESIANYNESASTRPDQAGRAKIHATPRCADRSSPPLQGREEADGHHGQSVHLDAEDDANDEFIAMDSGLSSTDVIRITAFEDHSTPEKCPLTKEATKTTKLQTAMPSSTISALTPISTPRPRRTTTATTGGTDGASGSASSSFSLY